MSQIERKAREVSRPTLEVVGRALADLPLRPTRLPSSACC